MDLDEAVARLREAGLVANRMRPYGEYGPAPFEIVGGGAEEITYENPKPGEPLGEILGSYDITPKGDRWLVDVWPIEREVATLDEAVAEVIACLVSKPCTVCGKEFRSGHRELCHACLTAQNREEVKRLAAERRAKFTLFAKFLLAKDKAFESIGVTLEVLVNEGLDRKTGVMGYYLDLRDVVQAFEKDPNDRAAFKRGMDILPKLIGLLKSYRDQAEGLEPSWSALKPKPLV